MPCRVRARCVPTALDAESEFVVQEAIERLMANRTTVLVAHRLSTVRDADTICVISKGKVAERGTHDELISNTEGVYTKLVARQMKAGGANGGASQEGSRHAGDVAGSTRE